MTRVPVIPTIVVAAAIATMIALGVWQLNRMDEKQAMLARYGAAQTMSAQVPYPADPAGIDAVLYRQTSVTCASLSGATTVAGRSAAGEPGLAHRATCNLPNGQAVTLDFGFSRDPAPVEWGGGEVRGTIAPGGRIVASQGVAGLEPLARPDPANIPNNHLAYAGQWFFFALTALVIYILALRRRGRDASAG